MLLIYAVAALWSLPTSRAPAHEACLAVIVLLPVLQHIVRLRLYWS